MTLVERLRVEGKYLTARNLHERRDLLREAVDAVERAEARIAELEEWQADVKKWGYRVG